MRTLWVATLAFALSFSGCFGGGDGGDDGPVTCPDGREVMPGEHAHGEGMDHNASEEEAELMEDPCFVAPKVTLAGLPTALAAYATDEFQWTVDNGTVPAGHSMLTSFRYATTPANDTELEGPESWGTELVKFEHNNLPVSFDGQIFFNAAGTYYMRAYAEVRGTGYSSHDYWSEEFVLNVTPVMPTGNDVTVSRGAGPHLSDQVPTGELNQTELNIQLGDGVIFANEHAAPVEFTFAGACPVDGTVTVDAAAPGGGPGVSETYVFTEPGLCTVTTNDQAEQTVEIRVASPAQV